MLNVFFSMIFIPENSRYNQFVVDPLRFGQLSRVPYQI